MAHFVQPATKVIIAIAAIQSLVGIAGILWGDPEPTQFPLWVGGLILLAFVSGAGLLLAGGRRDSRAVDLGAAFLLVASAFAVRFTRALARTAPGIWGELISFVGDLEGRDFLPFYLALFARSFPERTVPAWSQRLTDRLVQLLGAIGAVFFVAHLVAARGGGEPFATLSSWEDAGGYLAFGIVPLVLAFWRAGRATGVELRRARVFLAALVLGFGPILLEVLFEGLSPWYYRFSHRPRVRLALQIPLFSLLAMVPFTTAYAVLVHRVLDVRLIARRALQYALARYSTFALALVPFAALCGYLVRNREQTLAALFSGSQLLLLLTATTLGVLAIRYRRPALDAIDRRFFREEYDARRLLTLLVEQIRGSPNQAALADLVANGIDRALHLDAVGVLVADAGTGSLADPLGKLRPLDSSSPLAALVAAAPEPLEVDLAAPRAPLRTLPEEDRHWVADGGFQLLVPLLATDGSLLGILALGEKKSGLPFLAEDRQLLGAIAYSAAPALELQQLRRRGLEPPGTAAAGPEALPTTLPAMECAHCGRLFLAGTEACSSCRQSLEAASVPYVFPGKFRFESRLGAGGMGVVYRAVDLALGRPVAVKTLRRMSPEDALRLRREARTAATVSHPNLAFVFGVETWKGTPMLILEYLEGGTLAERLAAGSLPAMETVELGIAMAGALERLHAADILHRDVKPSNIGYARDGTPKLMDFGIARVRFDPRREAASPVAGGGYESLQPTLIVAEQEVTGGSSQRLVGTLFYLPPEAFDGSPPGPGFDLWSLSLVLFECLAAQRVFDGEDIGAIIRDIRIAGVPDIRLYRPDCPAVLSDFFARNLSRHHTLRAANATDLRRHLEEVRRQLLA
jgi:GAF domain-containing protein